MMELEMRRLTLLIALALGVAGTAGLASTADAGVVVVLSVRGDDSGELERMLGDAVAESHELRNDDDYQKVARREGLGSEDDRDIADVARKLGADIVIDPSLRRQDGGYVFRIKLRDRTGKVAKTMVVKMRKSRLGSSGKRDVAKELTDTIAAVLEADDGGGRRRGGRDRDDDDDDDDDDDRASRRDRDRDDDDEDEDDDRASRRDRDDDDEDDEDDDRARRRDRDDDDDDLDDEDDDRDRRGRKRRKKGAAPREIRRAAIVLETGVTGVKRTLTFSSRQNFEEAPRGYQGTFVPAGRVALELYPVAFAAPKSIAAGLGLYAEYEQVISLITRSERQPDVELPTQQVHWSVGGRFRFAFGDAPNLPSLVLSVGYGRRAFVVDRSPLPDGERLDLPDVDYRIIEPGVQLRIPVGTERVVLTLAGQALLFRTTGPIQTPQEYGAAKVTGVEGWVALDAAITRMVQLRLRGGLSQVGFDFTGNGMMSNLRDMDPAQDVGGALDRWLGTSASLAVLY